jgi:putative flippase GtrA
MTDYLLFTLMNLSFPGQLFYSIAVARAVSSTVNFSINRHLVFKNKQTSKKAIIRYYTLVIAIMLSSYGLVKLFSEAIGLNIYVSKIMADSLLTTFSFIIQRDYVYRK